MNQIKLINKDTDITCLTMRRYNWDVVVGSRPMFVVRIDGYVHTIGGKYGENDLWCYPRDQEPSVDNLIEFDGAGFCWGINATEHNYIKTKWDESEVRNSIGITITRNGEDFYSFCARDFGYALSKARTLISEFEDHPMNISEIGFAEKVVGRKIWWRESPAIVTRYIYGQACVMLSPDGIERFPRPKYYVDDDFYYESDSIKAEIFDKHIWWFRD